MTGHTAEEIRDTKGDRRARDADRLRLPDRPRARRVRARPHPGRGLAGRAGAGRGQHPRGDPGDHGPPRARRAQRGRAHPSGGRPAGGDATRPRPRRSDSARVLRAAGAESVKLEGARVDAVLAILADGIPVMGHVGLLPQTAGSYRRQGTTDESAERILADARALDAAGCYAIVIEAVPPALAARITAETSMPGHRHRRRAGLRRAGPDQHRPARAAAHRPALRHAEGRRLRGRGGRRPGVRRRGAPAGGRSPAEPDGRTARAPGLLGARRLLPHAPGHRAQVEGLVERLLVDAVLAGDLAQAAARGRGVLDDGAGPVVADVAG